MQRAGLAEVTMQENAVDSADEDEDEAEEIDEDDGAQEVDGTEEVEEVDKQCPKGYGAGISALEMRMAEVEPIKDRLGNIENLSARANIGQFDGKKWPVEDVQGLEVVLEEKRAKK